MEDKSNKDIKLSKEQKRHIKREYYIGKVREELKERYDKLVEKTTIGDRKKLEGKLGRKLDKYDERRIKRIRRNADRKVRRKLAIYSLLAAASITIGGSYLGNNMLVAGNNKAIETEAENDQTSELITKEFENQGKAFRQGLRDFEDNLKEIRAKTREEVYTLDTREDVVNYCKDFYIEDHNLNNENKITSRDEIEIRQTSQESGQDITYYKDKAKNGDEILRTCTQEYAKENNKTTLIADEARSLLWARVTAGEYKKFEQATAYIEWKDGQEIPHYVTVYSGNEDVNEYSKTTLSNVAKIVYKGLNLMGNIETGDAHEVSGRKSELINAVVEYRSNQMRNERSQSTENEINIIQKNEEERE